MDTLKLPLKGLEHAITYMKNKLLSSNLTIPCLETGECLEATRKLVIGLKMVEWGVHSQEETTAGSYLAYHHLMLGPYFGDVDGNEWPHIPLYKEPTSLEHQFNELLTNITFEMSNHKLRDVSLLDLPSFGSTIVTLKRGLKKQFIWPVKMNFALLKTKAAENTSNLLMSYKTLTEDWADYMDQLYSKDHAKYFTSEMKENKYFDFTQFIKADIKTFLAAISGNHNIDVFRFWYQKVM